jgi:hypothetical protein
MTRKWKPGGLYSRNANLHSGKRCNLGTFATRARPHRSTSAQCSTSSTAAADAPAFQAVRRDRE